MTVADGLTEEENDQIEKEYEICMRCHHRHYQHADNGGPCKECNRCDSFASESEYTQEQLLNEKCARCGHTVREHWSIYGCTMCDAPQCPGFMYEREYTSDVRREWEHQNEKCARCNHARLSHQSSDGCNACIDPFGPVCKEFLTLKSYTSDLQRRWQQDQREAQDEEERMSDPNADLIEEERRWEEEQEALAEYEKWHGPAYGREITFTYRHPLLGITTFSCCESELECFGFRIDENDKVVPLEEG